MTRTLAQHIVTAERLALNGRGFLERRENDARWPQSDIQRGRSLLADTEALVAFLKSLEGQHERSTSDTDARGTPGAAG